MNTERRRQRRTTVFEKKMELSDLCSRFLPANLPTLWHPRGSFLFAPSQSSGSARPCPGSGTLFPVLHWEGVEGTILELGCLGSSPRSHSSLSNSLNGCVTLDKSLHFPTSAMRAVMVPTSRACTVGDRHAWARFLSVASFCFPASIDQH